MVWLKSSTDFTLCVDVVDDFFKLPKKATVVFPNLQHKLAMLVKGWVMKGDSKTKKLVFPFRNSRITHSFVPMGLCFLFTPIKPFLASLFEPEDQIESCFGTPMITK